MEIQNRCRLCLSDKNLIDLFHECVVETDELRRFIYDASGVEVLRSDFVTKKVCRRCCTVSVKLHKFRTNAVANDKWLKEQYMQLAGNENAICVIKNEFVDLDSDLEELDIPSCSVTNENTVPANQKFTCDVSSSLLFSSTPYRPPVVKTTTAPSSLLIKTLYRSVPTSSNQQNQTLPINTTNTFTNADETTTIQPVVNNKSVETVSDRTLRSSLRNKPQEKAVCTSTCCRDAEIPVLQPIFQEENKKSTFKNSKVNEKQIASCAEIPLLQPIVQEETNKKLAVNNNKVKEKQVARKSTTPRLLPSVRYNNNVPNVSNSSNYEEPPQLDCMVQDEAEREKSKKFGQNGFSGEISNITDSLLHQLLKGCKSASYGGNSKIKSTSVKKPKYKCKFCIERFTIKMNLFAHLTTHPKCSYCSNRQKNEVRAIQHLRVCRGFNKKLPKIILQKVDTVKDICDKYPSVFNVKIKQEIEEDVQMDIENLFESTLVEGSQVLNVKKLQKKSPKNVHQEKSKKMIVKSKLDKKFCCPYCKTCVTQLLRHLLWSHQDEAEVANLMLFPIGSKERIEILSQLKERGSVFLNENKTCKPIKRKNIFLFYPCPLCEGYFTKFILLEHYKICSKKDEVPDDLVNVSRSLINRFLNEANLVMQDRAIPFLRDSFSLNVVKNDRLLLQYGSHLSLMYSKEHHDVFNERVIIPLRRVSQFLRQLKIIKPMVPNLSAVFDEDLFPDIIYAIKHLRCKNEEFKIAFGTILKDIVQIEIQNSKNSNNVELERRLNCYLYMHSLCYDDDNTWKKQSVCMN